MVSPLPTSSLRVPNARPFVLRPDWNGQVQQREVVDVNLGHTPESFVRAAHAQIQIQIQIQSPRRINVIG